MAKRIAVLAVNPVNGLGLFQYLESFYENQIIYRVYAVAETTDMRTNSGIRFYADDVIENLKGLMSMMHWYSHVEMPSLFLKNMPQRHIMLH